MSRRTGRPPELRPGRPRGQPRAWRADRRTRRIDPHRPGRPRIRCRMPAEARTKALRILGESGPRDRNRKSLSVGLHLRDWPVPFCVSQQPVKRGAEFKPHPDEGLDPGKRLPALVATDLHPSYSSKPQAERGLREPGLLSDGPDPTSYCAFVRMTHKIWLDRASLSKASSGGTSFEKASLRWTRIVPETVEGRLCTRLSDDSA